MGFSDRLIDDTLRYAKAVGKNILESNKSINSAYFDTIKRIDSAYGEGTFYANRNKARDFIKKTYQHEDGSYKKGMIVGSMLMGGATMRQVTGRGGLLYDGDGNFDVAGIPFI